MAKTTSGGQGICDIFRVNTSADGTMTIVEGLTIADPEIPVAATTNSDRAFRLSEIVGTTPDPQEDGIMNFTFEQYEDSEELDTFLDTVAVPPSSTTGAMPAYKLENGTERTQASINNNLVLLVWHGPSDGAKIKTIFALGTISATSGGFTTKADDWNKPTFKFVGTKSLKALTIATGLVDATVVTLAASKTIAKGTCFVRTWIPKAA